MSRARVGVESVLSERENNDGSSAQKDNDDITSLRAEFRRMVLDKVQWSSILLVLGYVPIFLFSCAAAFWKDLFDTGGQYWWISLIGSLLLSAVRTRKLCLPYCKRGRSCECKWSLRLPRSERKCVCGIFHCCVTRIKPESDRQKRFVLLSWALTFALAWLLIGAGALQYSLVSQCEGPHAGAMLNGAKMKLWNLTLEKLVDGDDRACSEYNVACNASTSPCPQYGTWEVSYTCDFCEKWSDPLLGSRPCYTRRRTINMVPHSVFCFKPLPIHLNTAFSILQMVVGVCTIVLAVSRFAKTVKILFIKYDVKQLALAPYPPHAPVPKEMLNNFVEDERRAANV